MSGPNDKVNIIIVKKKSGGHGGHHGGAWKVAYADFVTAMMAFFLLLWMLNVTTSPTKAGDCQLFRSDQRVRLHQRLGRHYGRHVDAVARRPGFRKQTCRRFDSSAG